MSSPLPCFGREYDQDDPRCEACAHVFSCQKYMGSRGNRKLVALKFNLTPKLLAPLKIADPELGRLQDLYAQCYFTIFEQAPPDRLDNKPAAPSILEKACEEAQCSLRLFLLATMYGHKICSPDRAFYANMLLGPAAIKRVAMYRRACGATFGSFDLIAMSDLMGRNDPGVAAQMLNSEVIAGTWIIGYKLHAPGPFAAQLYQACEMALNPYWLATDEHYVSMVLQKPQEKSTAELKQHRFNATQTLIALKRDKQKARLVFNLREQNAIEATRRVLAHFGLLIDNVTTTDSEVNDMLVYWGKLAIAIKTYFLRRYLDGDNTFLNYLKA